MKLQGNHSPAEQDLTSCQAAMSCLVLADGLRESVRGHTKMDIKLLEVSSMTYQIRWEELLLRSHLSSWRWIWIQASKGNSSSRNYAIRRRTGLLKAWETKYVDVSTVCYMDESLDEHMSTLYESHITLSDGSSKLAQQRRRYARTPKSNKG